MEQLIRDYPDFLLGEHQPPCLSLYQPTHLSHPENAQDPIRFRVLLKALEKSLRAKYPSHDIPALLQPFEALAKDRDFWNHTNLGLAVFGAPGLFRVYKLPRPVLERAVVDDSFHTKPLMRIVQSADSYQVLGLSRSSFSMYEGNRDTLYRLPPIEGVPYTANDQALAAPDSREGAHRAYGRRAAAHHGTDVKQDADDRDIRKFFRAVDRAVTEHFSGSSGQRLILAALPQHHRLFRSISRNQFLISEGIEANPEALSLETLRERAWELMLPHYLKRLAGFVEAFGAASSNGRGAESLDAIAAAAFAGKVETLLVEADRVIPGKLNFEPRNADSGKRLNHEVDDLLDDISEQVLRTGGEVIIVPTERMPTQTGAAAIYRF
ncbi:MAG TPA: hypothetical protein PKK10_15465 [Woeseiaceae bacterium]|nr:hypothetical protein [Woeseiaceae bacterium]